MIKNSVSAENKVENVQTKEYLIDGKAYKVVRHFSGGKDLKTIIAELASNCAKRDMGL